MKKILILSSFLIGGILFSQVKIPQRSSKGNITTTANTVINYTNLIYEKGKVTFINSETGNEEFLYDNSIKNVEYNPETQNGKISELDAPKTENSMMKVVEPVSLQNNNYITNSDYIKAKKLNQLGNAFLIGGGACFLVGGILNLSSGSDKGVNAQNQVAPSQGSPVPLIIGLAGMGAGLVMKIAGGSSMKNIKNRTANNLNSAKEYYVMTNNNGFGIKIKF